MTCAMVTFPQYGLKNVLISFPSVIKLPTMSTEQFECVRSTDAA